MGKKKVGTGPPRRAKRSDGGIKALRKAVMQTQRDHTRMVQHAALAQRQVEVLAGRLRDAEAKLAAAEARMAPGAAGAAPSRKPRTRATPGSFARGSARPKS